MKGLCNAGLFCWLQVYDSCEESMCNEGICRHASPIRSKLYNKRKKVIVNRLILMHRVFDSANISSQ